MLSAKSSPCDRTLANYASIGSMLLEWKAFLIGVCVAKIRMPRHCKTQLTLVLQQAGVGRGPSPIPVTASEILCQRGTRYTARGKIEVRELGSVKMYQRRSPEILQG